MIHLTPDLRLLLAPAETYRRMARGSGGVAPRAALRALVRVAAPVVVVGVATGLSATGRINWSLALSGALCWSFVAAVQLIVATAAIGLAGSRVGRARAIELFFVGHAAWSLWLLAVAALSVAGPGVPLERVALSAIVPAAWTPLVVFAFFRQVLGLTRTQSAARTILHQTLTHLVILGYFAWAVQLWPRLLAQQVP